MICEALNLTESSGFFYNGFCYFNVLAVLGSGALLITLLLFFTIIRRDEI